MKRGQSGFIVIFVIVAILGVSLMWFVAGPGIPQIHLGAATGLQTNIDVVVKDANNAPVSGATVSICPSSCAKNSPAGQKITDSRGVARFSSMPVGAYQATAAELSAFFTAKYVQPPKAFTVVLKPRPCIDSDVGAEMPSLVPGTISGPKPGTNVMIEKSDYCDDAGLLSEYYCDGGFVAQKLFGPAQGCPGCAYMPLKEYSANVAGVCVPVRPTTGCYESDNGLDILNRGYTFPAASAYGKFDMCVDKNKLSEYYCDQGDAGSQIVDCPNGCKNGACVAPQVTLSCTDSDGGKNPNVFGQTNGVVAWWEPIAQNVKLHDDFCTTICEGSVGSGKAQSGPCLVEFSCQSHPQNGGPAIFAGFDVITCPNGCKDGVCTPSSAVAQTYAWQLIPQGYYDPTTFVQSLFGTQAKFTATCVKVCSDLNHQADAKCVGWGTFANSCRKTMSANQPEQLASASPTCTETDLTGIIGFDYCCCSQ